MELLDVKDVLDIFKVVDDHDHKFYTTLYTRLLHYSDEFKRFYDLREGNILKCFDPWQETPSNTQIVMIENIRLIGSVYAIKRNNSESISNQNEMISDKKDIIS